MSCNDMIRMLRITEAKTREIIAIADIKGNLCFITLAGYFFPNFSHF